MTKLLWQVTSHVSDLVVGHDFFEVNSDLLGVDCIGVMEGRVGEHIFVSQGLLNFADVLLVFARVVEAADVLHHVDTFAPHGSR